MKTEAIETMGRPKKRAAKGKAEAKRSVISIRGSEPWYEWFTELAEFCRMPGTVVIDQALVEFAQRKGFTKPAPPR